MAPSVPAVDLSGRVAIVTGGGRGLGHYMARALAAGGAAVAVAGRSAEHLDQTVAMIQAAGGQALAVQADVTDRAAVERMARQVEERFGAVDVLVNNAGVTGAPGPLWEANPDAWWQVMDVNVRGAMLCAWAVLPGMVRRQRGRIINVASAAGIVTIPYGAAYCVSKAALIRLTDCLAADTHEHGIAVFAISPGTVRTAMSEYLVESDEGKQWLPWFASIFEEGRDLPPEQGANLVAFLASGQADGLSGRFIQASDDVVEMARQAEQIQRDDRYTLRLRV